MMLWCYQRLVLRIDRRAGGSCGGRLILTGVLVLLVLLVIVWAASRSDGSALGRRPVAVRHLDHSLVSLSSYPRTYVDPAETTARADLPAAVGFGTKAGQALFIPA